MAKKIVTSTHDKTPKSEAPDSISVRFLNETEHAVLTAQCLLGSLKPVTESLLPEERIGGKVFKNFCVRFNDGQETARICAQTLMEKNGILALLTDGNYVGRFSVARVAGWWIENGR